LTAYLTQNRADRVIELRGSGGKTTHLHLDSLQGPLDRQSGFRAADGSPGDSA
jgi:hypothetical protein